ncbi:MAG: hypothetical protein HN480_03580 [Gammaproteobacteria bacterium]|nr:hypothetical protein [Gammaproteobacteria bacterium]
MITKKTLIYIMGAGRSGTTALATFLGNSSEILNLGEMHQYFKHIVDEKECSCGKLLNECEFWRSKIDYLTQESSENSRKLSEKMESHSSIIKHLLNSFSNIEYERYIELHQSILDSIQSDSEKSTLLDSSKYIGRALALNKLDNIELKIIYVVRDVRGVINSFSKKVQTSKSPPSTIVYYSLINLVAEFISRFIFRKKVIQIRYEDLINNPNSLFDRLESFLNLNLQDVKGKVERQKAFEIGHIVGGNRLKKNKEIYFRKDVSWKKNFSWVERIIYYILAAPIMILNRYKF